LRTISTVALEKPEAADVRDQLAHALEGELALSGNEPDAVAVVEEVSELAQAANVPASSDAAVVRADPVAGCVAGGWAGAHDWPSWSM